MKTCVYLCAPVLACALACTAAAAEPVVTDPDERYLRDLKIPTDNAGLMAYLRERANADDDLRNLPALIAQLGDRNFAARQQAEARLKKLGLPALPPLRAALTDPDKEVVRRARICIDDIAKDSNWSPPLAAARLLVRRKLPEATVPLLRFLPYVGACETTEEEIWFGLSDLAEREPKLRAMLTHVLRDPMPARRALAACILGRQGDDAQKEAVRRLLTDPVTTVRLRAAQGLLAGQDKAAIPVLIALLGDAPIYEAWQAEELLHWVAGDETPASVLGAGATETRKKTRGMWEGWWKGQEPKLDWAKVMIDHRRPGLLLLTGHTDGGREEPREDRLHHAWLYGGNGKPRWQLSERRPTPFPCAQLAPGDRILLGPAEYDLDGKALLQTADVDAARRLPNGNTFFQRVWTIKEMTPHGQVAYEHGLNERKLGGLRLMGEAQIARQTSGRIAIFRQRQGGSAWDTLEVDVQAGNATELSTLEIGRRFAPRFRALPDGRVLATDKHFFGKTKRLDAVVWLLDPKGKVERRWDIYAVDDALWLANGNLLVLGMPVKGARGILEIDQQGRIVWDAYADGDTESIDHVARCLTLVRLGFNIPRQADLRTDFAYHLRQIKNGKGAYRARSVQFLTALGPQLEPAVPALIDILTEAKPDQADIAGNLLHSVGASIIPKVVHLLKDSDAETRKRTISVVAQSCPEAKIAIPLLADVLKDKDPSVRELTARALGDIGKEVREATPLLLEALQDKNVGVRNMAFTSLARVGPTGKDAIPTLLKLLKEEQDLFPRRVIPRALVTIAPNDEKVIAALIEALKNKRASERLFIAAALRNAGAQAAIPVFREIAGDQNEDLDLRSEAEEALRQLGNSKIRIGN